MKKLTPFQARILTALDLKIDTWSPGDGTTRYKLVPLNSGYWEAAHAFPTFLGRAELNTAIAALAIVVDLLPEQRKAEGSTV